MEHVTEGLYMAASAGLFVLAVSLTLMMGRAVDGMFAAQQAVSLPGETLYERAADGLSDMQREGETDE